MRTHFDLPPELTIYTAGDIRQSLLAWLEEPQSCGGEPLEIAADAVQDVDGAGLQLLGSLTRTLSNRNMQWHFRNPSATLIEACKALGSEAWLLPPEHAGAHSAEVSR